MTRPTLAALLPLLLATPAAADSPYHFTQSTGPALYAAACAGCHMPNAQGAQGAGIYPSLAQNPRLAASPYPITRILHGGGAMPALGGMLSDAQIAAIVTYIRTNFGNTYPNAPTPADVAALR